MPKTYKRNRLTFGLGTFGRDMVYSLVSMYLIYYLTDVIKLPTATLWWVSGIILAARIFDALNDPVMGCIVDNTRSRWGKFKPWIAIGAPVSAVVTVLLFTDFGLTGGAFIAVFAVIYLLWGISYTIHDISYWSMLPVLSIDQKEREKIGAIARICANVGMFIVVAGIVPLTAILGESFGGLQKGFFVFSIAVAIMMTAGMCVTLFGVKETDMITEQKQSTPLRELVRVIFKNDQLFFTAIAMSLFMIGYVTTASFGLYFFKYAYGDENMYMVFAIVLGVSQITALSIFPLFSKHFDRKTLFTAAIILIAAGYIIFFFAPVNTMTFFGIGGALIFIGQSFVQVLMLMFLTDSVDYGHWKLGKRNDSITFSLQPLINKMGGAISSGVVSVVIILSGIKDAETAAEVTAGGLLMMKLAMLIFPLLCITASYVIYRAKYKIDSRFYEQILSDLRARGEIKNDVESA
ncbi:MAG: glycoside-pentoside-hexuronide (GPH):cation symporter [Treponema sp.]|jgi:melibiose permease/lactose/raffinose/galactose permease|nr:glycoside-pentoside-hexuronide (GPH):cation symporter [Treponema sp.]